MSPKARFLRRNLSCHFNRRSDRHPGKIFSQKNHELFLHLHDFSLRIDLIYRFTVEIFDFIDFYQDNSTSLQPLFRGPSTCFSCSFVLFTVLVNDLRRRFSFFCQIFLISFCNGAFKKGKDQCN